MSETLRAAVRLLPVLSEVFAGSTLTAREQWRQRSGDKVNFEGRTLGLSKSDVQVIMRV